VRRQRRELDAARETLRRELGHEPSLADLAAKVGSDEKRLSRTIVRINTIESTSPLASGDRFAESALPPALVPAEPDAPDAIYEKTEIRERVRLAIQSLPWRERKLIGLYYYGEVTMKQIGIEIGVNESRVSQLHARAIRRLRDALGALHPKEAQQVHAALVAFAARKPMAKALSPAKKSTGAAVVLPYKPAAKRHMPSSPLKMAASRSAVALAR